MSGDSEAPPTYYFSGITFNPDFYQSTTGNYLTQTTAKNYFLTYPSAQGTETITTLNSSSINSSSATSDISIVPSQTTGTLNIGTNSTTTTRTTGAINIGSNVLGTTPITIGMSGKSTTALNGTVSVGSSMTTNGISNTGTISSSGSISANGGLSATTLSASSTATTTGLLTATGGIKTSTIDTASGGTMAIGASTTGGITIGFGNAPTTVAGSLTSSGQITASAGISMGTNTSIFTTSGQQLRLGYANTQTSGSGTSSFGPYIKSFGPAAVSASTYDILYDGTTGLVPTGVDGWGGLLTIYIKSGSAKIATYVYSVAKRNGNITFAGMSVISLNAVVGGTTPAGWTTNSPSIGSAPTPNDNNIRITFNASDWSGATVSWTLIGCI